MGLSLGLGIAVNKKDVVSVDFTPSDLGSTMLVWYKNQGMRDASGTDGTSANRLEWADVSGNNNHAIQDTTADKPAVAEGGCLDFELDDTDSMDLTTPLDFGHPNQFTFFFVVERESVSTQQALIGSTGTNQFIAFSTNADRLKVRSSGSGGDNITFTFATATGLWPADEPFILTITKDDVGRLMVYKDGVHQAESGGGVSVNNGATMTFAHLGTKQPDTHNFDGSMCEIIICDTVLSDGDRNNTITYLKDKFSI